jgi:hypothetical protein
MLESPVDCLFPFFRVDETRDRPSVYGSGVLLKLPSRHLLLSAAHVFDEERGNIWFSEGVVADGAKVEIHTSHPPEGKKSNDMLDVGVCAFPAEIAQRLESQGFKFIRAGDIDVNDASSEGRTYAFTGFPGSKQNSIDFRSRKMRLKPMEYSLGCRSPSTIAKDGFVPSIHIAAHFDRTAMMDGKGARITAPEPFGMSGGGVWHRSSSGYSLIGIGTEWDDRNKVLLGTRIGVLVSLIRRSFPDTMPYLQESTKFNVAFNDRPNA